MRHTLSGFLMTVGLAIQALPSGVTCQRGRTVETRDNILERLKDQRAKHESLTSAVPCAADWRSLLYEWTVATILGQSVSLENASSLAMQGPAPGATSIERGLDDEHVSERGTAWMQVACRLFRHR